MPGNRKFAMFNFCVRIQQTTKNRTTPPADHGTNTGEGTKHRPEPLVQVHIQQPQLLGQDNLYVVDTLDGISLYSNEEMKEIYNVDCDNGNLERLGWSA